MFEKGKEDIIEYCLRFMMSKESIGEFLEGKGIDFDITTFEKTAKTLKNSDKIKINLNELRQFTRSKWMGTDVEFHIKNLNSGLLRGHDWHGSMPSFLHLSLQKKVREAIMNMDEIESLLEVGTDIMKQEYFIVATHDLCETTIIISNEDSIPSIKQMGVSDFIFKEIPYDLKNSGVPNGWSFEQAKENPIEFVESLMEGADTERLRKQAQNSINNWGLNRFYVILKNVDDWIGKSKEILEKIKKESKKLRSPIKIKKYGIEISCQLILVD